MEHRDIQVGDFVKITEPDGYRLGDRYLITNINPENGNITTNYQDHGRYVEFSPQDNGKWMDRSHHLIYELKFKANPYAKYTDISSLKSMSQEEKDRIIGEVREGLTEEDLSGEKKLYMIGGTGIHENLVIQFRSWVVNASSTREAYFIVFSLETQFFEDLVHYWSRYNSADSSLEEEVLDYEGGRGWFAVEVEGNQIYGQMTIKGIN